MVSLFSVAFVAVANSSLTLIVNGKVSDVEPIVIDGTTYVPVRAAAEMLGAEVKYDAASRSVTITAGTGEAPPVQQPSSLKEVDVDISIKSGPMELSITKVTLDPNYKPSQYQDPINAIIMDAKAENTSEDKISWFFTQGQIVLNTKEQVDTGIFYSDSVDGEFNGEVVKEGKIIFEVKSNLDEVSDIRYNVGAPIDSDWDRLDEEKEVHITIE